MHSKWLRCLILHSVCSIFISSQFLTQDYLVRAQPHTQNTATRTPTWRGWPAETGANDQYTTALDACRSVAIYLRNRPSNEDVTVIPKQFNDYGSPVSVACLYEDGGIDGPVQVNCGPWSFTDEFYGPYQYIGDENEGTCVNYTIIAEINNFQSELDKGCSVFQEVSLLWKNAKNNNATLKPFFYKNYTNISQIQLICRALSASALAAMGIIAGQKISPNELQNLKNEPPTEEVPFDENKPERPEKIDENTDTTNTDTWPSPPVEGELTEGKPSRLKPRLRGEKSLYDNKRGEWRPHKPDKYHDTPHWNYKPVGKNVEWQNIDLDGNRIP